MTDQPQTPPQQTPQEPQVKDVENVLPANLISLSITFPARWKWNQRNFTATMRNPQWNSRVNPSIYHDTESHLKRAIDALGNGETDLEDEWKAPRIAYEVPENDDVNPEQITFFGNSYALISWDGVSYWVPFNINKFTEFNTAQELIDAVYAYIAMHGVYEAVERNFKNNPEFIKRDSDPSTVNFNSQNSQSGRQQNANNTQQQTPPPTQQQQPQGNANPTTVMYTAPTSKEQQEQFIAQMNGQAFGLNVRGFQLNTRNNVASVQFFCEFNGGRSQYAFYPLTYYPFKKGSSEPNNADVNQWLSSFNNGNPPNAGQIYECDGRWVGYHNFNQSNGKTYWNVSKIENRDPSIQAVNLFAQPQQQNQGQGWGGQSQGQQTPPPPQQQQNQGWGNTQQQSAPPPLNNNSQANTQW